MDEMISYSLDAEDIAYLCILHENHRKKYIMQIPTLKIGIDRLGYLLNFGYIVYIKGDHFDITPSGINFVESIIKAGILINKET